MEVSETPLPAYVYIVRINACVYVLRDRAYKVTNVCVWMHVCQVQLGPVQPIPVSHLIPIHTPAIQSSYILMLTSRTSHLSSPITNFQPKNSIDRERNNPYLNAQRKVCVWGWVYMCVNVYVYLITSCVSICKPNLSNLRYICVWVCAWMCNCTYVPMCVRVRVNVYV